MERLRQLINFVMNGGYAIKLVSEYNNKDTVRNIIAKTFSYDPNYPLDTSTMHFLSIRLLFIFIYQKMLIFPNVVVSLSITDFEN